MKTLRLGLAMCAMLLLVACAGGPVAPAWQADAKGALDRATAAWLAGDSRVHEAEMARARRALSATGRTELLARAELMRCAARVASLVFEPCERFEALRADAAAAERAYADHLAARKLAAGDIALLPATQQIVASGAVTPVALQGIEDPLSRLIAIAVLFQTGQASPAMIETAVETASAQGWRRPLLAWLSVQTMRAEKAGDAAEAQRLKRRIAVVEGR